MGETDEKDDACVEILSRKYCQMCGDFAAPETVTCERCKPVYFALHNFVHQWELNLAPEVEQALLKSVYQFDPQTGRKV